MPRPSFVLIVALTLAIVPTARGAGPADALFRLVPPDAGLTLAIEDLRGHARDFLASPLADGIAHLPAVVASRESGQIGRIERSLKTIEKLLGTSLPKIRDDLLGDAIVLTLRFPPSRKPDEARGLLLVRPRDRALLDRLIEGINTAQLKSGELARFSVRVRNGSPYSVREYRKAGRSAEYYTVLDDNTLAWSNSEELVQGVIDRKAGKVSGLADQPRFRKVRDRLPGRVAVSLFADPVILGRLLPAMPRPTNPGERWLAAVVTRYTRALAYVGVALQWRDGFILHTEEAINSARLDSGFRQVAQTGTSLSPWRGVPSTALALASARVDPVAVLEIAREPLREPGRIRLDNLLVVVGGLMLGRDVRTEILPRIGPGLSVFVDAPAVVEEGTQPDFPVVAAIDLKPDEGKDKVDIAAAVDNALRTTLALKALDVKKGIGPRQVVSREVGNIKVTTLDANSPFAYATRADRLTIGNRAEAVARGLGGEAPLDSPLAKLRAAYFPESDTFACADLVALGKLAGTFREPLARRLAARRKTSFEAAARDIDQALALVELFRGAFITSTMAPDASSVHRTIGLIARDPASGRPWSDTAKPK
jgi:hypothetical protein